MLDISALKAAGDRSNSRPKQQVLVARGRARWRSAAKTRIPRYAVDWSAGGRRIEASIGNRRITDIAIPPPLRQSHWSNTLPYDPEQYPDSHLTQGDVVLILLRTIRGLKGCSLLPESVRSSMIAPIMCGRPVRHDHRPPDRISVSEQDGNFSGLPPTLGNLIERSRTDLSLQHRINHLFTDRPAQPATVHPPAGRGDRRGGLAGRHRRPVVPRHRPPRSRSTTGSHAGDELLRDRAAAFGQRPPRGHGGLVRWRRVRDRPPRSSRSTSAGSGPVACREHFEPIPVAGTERFVTASIGVATHQPGWKSRNRPRTWIRDADAAMYLVKDSGRARVASRQNVNRFATGCCVDWTSSASFTARSKTRAAGRLSPADHQLAHRQAAGLRRRRDPLGSSRGGHPQARALSSRSPERATRASPIITPTMAAEAVRQAGPDAGT